MDTAFGGFPRPASFGAFPEQRTAEEIHYSNLATGLAAIRATGAVSRDESIAIRVQMRTNRMALEQCAALMRSHGEHVMADFADALVGKLSKALGEGR